MIINGDNKDETTTTNLGHNVKNNKYDFGF